MHFKGYKKIGVPSNAKKRRLDVTLAFEYLHEYMQICLKIGDFIFSILLYRIKYYCLHLKSI